MAKVSLPRRSLVLCAALLGFVPGGAGCLLGTDSLQVAATGGTGSTTGSGRRTDGGADAGPGDGGDGGLTDGGFVPQGVGDGSYPCLPDQVLFSSAFYDIVAVYSAPGSGTHPVARAEVWTSPPTSQAVTDDAGRFNLCVKPQVPFVTHVRADGYFSMALEERVQNVNTVYDNPLPLINSTLVPLKPNAVLVSILETDPRGRCHSLKQCFAVSVTAWLPDGGGSGPDAGEEIPDGGLSYLNLLTPTVPDSAPNSYGIAEITGLSAASSFVTASVTTDLACLSGAVCPSESEFYGFTGRIPLSTDADTISYAPYLVP